MQSESFNRVADQAPVARSRQILRTTSRKEPFMQDGVRGHSPARRVSPALILLVLGLTTFFPTYTSAAPLDKPVSKPGMDDKPGLAEEQILSTTDKITQPVDTDAEAMRHNDLGVAFVFKGDLGQAIDEFKHALRLQPNYFAAHLNLANTLLDVGRNDAAMVEFKEALRLKPDDPKTHNDLGVALKEMGNLEGAIAEFRTVLRHNPSDVNAHNNLGVTLKAMGDLDGAIAEYRTAASLQPNDVNAHFNLGLGLMEKRQPEAAVSEFRTALHLRPNDAKIRLNLGNALAGMGQRMEAAQELRQYLRLELDTPANRRWLEQAEAKLRELEMP
ncbi:MAG: tetratricopeptide repeat protein [Nitrospira sp.]|nr:MAG: tetratricopeptide repeat protein [Nitrospira sp.]